MKRKIIIGSRGSKLALWQAEHTKSILEEKGYPVEIKIIKTQGDKIQHLSFDKMEGKGFFTKELEDELLDKTIDLAVHSHKDLPTTSPPGLVIAGVSDREDPAECILIRKEAYREGNIIAVKENAIVGTSAPRRKSQLLFFRPDLTIRDLRGNVPTRIGKLENGDYDAIILAKAGMKRLKLNPENLIVKTLNPVDFIPAPAQGVLAFQVREEDAEMRQIISEIEDKATAEIIQIERSLLRSIEGGCQVPAGILCRKLDDTFHLWATLAEDNHSVPKRIYHTFKQASAFQPKAVTQMLKQKQGASVFISTDLEENDDFYKILTANKYQIEARSLVNFEALEFNLPEEKFQWLFFTSKNGVNYFFDQLNNTSALKNLKIAAVGDKTANTVFEKGFTVDFVIDHTDIKKGVDEFLEAHHPESVLIPGAKNSSNSVFNALNQKVRTGKLPVYNNTPLSDFTVREADILVFTSSMNAKAYFEKYTSNAHQKIVVIGKYTADTITSLNLPVHRIAHKHSLLHLADAVFSLELGNVEM